MHLLSSLLPLLLQALTSVIPEVKHGEPERSVVVHFVYINSPFSAAFFLFHHLPGEAQDVVVGRAQLSGLQPGSLRQRAQRDGEARRGGFFVPSKHPRFPLPAVQDVSWCNSGSACCLNDNFVVPMAPLGKRSRGFATDTGSRGGSRPRPSKTSTSTRRAGSWWRRSWKEFQLPGTQLVALE